MEKTKVTYMDVDSLIPYANSPRLNDNAVDAVAAGIKESGFKVPVVVDGENAIIDGHTRLKAAHKLGMKQVPVIAADDLTPGQVKAFRLADNKTGEPAQRDMAKPGIEPEGRTSCRGTEASCPPPSPTRRLRRRRPKRTPRE